MKCDGVLINDEFIPEFLLLLPDFFIILDINSCTLTLFLGKSEKTKDRRVRIEDDKIPPAQIGMSLN